jgi:DNA-binding response OmpR family regulator
MRVLIVEDQERLRTWLQKGLREADFVVDAAGDGKEGLWYTKNNVYDVIILDLMLPELDGLSLLRNCGRRARRPGPHPDGQGYRLDRVKGLDLGADDYLVKPFAFEELLARLRALIRRGYGKHSPIIVIGDLCIDTAKRLASVEARRSSCAPWSTSSWNTSRDALARPSAVRRFGNICMTSVSDGEQRGYVYIGALRRKLDPRGERNLIQTRRGLGYVLNAGS